MKKGIKLNIFLILVLAMAISVFGCAKKSREKQSEKKMTDAEIEKLFDMKRISGGFAIAKYKGISENVTIPNTYKGYNITEINEKAFAETSYVERIKIQANLKKIGSEAFTNSSLEEFINPSTLEKIDDRAFLGCKNLKKVTLNEGLKEIDWAAFKGTSIKEITIPNTMERIAGGAFENCANLKKVVASKAKAKLVTEESFVGCDDAELTILSDDTTIGENEFKNCNFGIKKIALASSITRIEESAFAGSNIEEITIPSTVKVINTRFGDVKINVAEENPKYKAINNCLIEKATDKVISGGKYSTIPYDINEIGANAFENTTIENIYIPNAIARIGDDAFKNCKRLKKVIVSRGGNLDVVKEESFAGCDNAELFLNFYDGLRPYEFANYKFGIKKITLPNTIREIPPDAFRGSNIEKIMIPSTVKKIDREAFKDCINLKTVTLNEGLKEITGSFLEGGGVFQNSNIEEITIPSTVEKIEKKTFYNCKNLKRVTLKEGLKEIEKDAFSKTNIEEVIIPSTVERIGEDAFSDSKNLKRVILNEGLKEIEKDAFSKTNIEEVIIPSTVERIGEDAFSDSKNLKRVILNEGLKEIEGYYHSMGTFSGTNIEEITIPSTVEKIGEKTFHNCKNLKRVTLKEGLKEIEEDVFSETNIEEITIPSTVKKIGSNAFKDCKNLKIVNLKEGLKEIGHSVFDGTKINKITIPSTVEKIESGAFEYYSKLTQIDCKLKKSYVEANRSKFQGLLYKESIINWVNG